MVRHIPWEERYSGSRRRSLPELSERGHKLRDLLAELIEAEAELKEAKERVPDYTGHLSDEDYYADEEAVCRLIIKDLEEIIFEGK